jgi:hypothetical protein
MKKFEGIPMPESWEDITLKQFSEYNETAVDFKEELDKIDEKDEDAITQALIKDVKYNYKVIEIFSLLPEESVYEIDIATANEYVDNLNFLREKYEPKEIKYFSFEGTNYNLPDSLPINTKFGQYIESLQAEMITKYTEKNSIIYLAHQIAHMVDNGEDWNAKERDELAKKFEGLPASTGLDFSFFLSKKCLIYSQAYLRLVALQQVEKMPFIKRIYLHLVGLKHYMNWQKLKFSINLIKARLKALSTLTRERFFSIYYT